MKALFIVIVDILMLFLHTVYAIASITTDIVIFLITVLIIVIALILTIIKMAIGWVIGDEDETSYTRNRSE